MSCSPSPSPCGRRSTGTRASTSTRSPPTSTPSWRSPPQTETSVRLVGRSFHGPNRNDGTPQSAPAPPSASWGSTIRPSVLERGLPPLVDGDENRQHTAAAVAASAALTVIAGGPGTGKTHTVAGLLAAEGAGGKPVRIGLA